jgi:hypothetical protein
MIVDECHDRGGIIIYNEIFVFTSAVVNLSQNIVCEFLLNGRIPDMTHDPTYRCYLFYCLQLESIQNL